MARLLLLSVTILIAGCTGNTHPLAHTSMDDPVWSIAPDRWAAGDNTLTTSPTLTSGRIPQAIK